MARHLVTGAGSGIGRELAVRLLARGDELVLLARSEERARDLAQRYAGATVLVADLADPASVQRLELPDALDSLVHSAGHLELAPVADLPLEHWQDQLNVNLVAPALLTQVALPALRAAGGTVVLVNSGAGLRSGPGKAAYSGSKFGLRALADALRDEESAAGVRVTTVYPGRTATPMQEKVHAQEGREYDAADWIRPGTVADSILHVLDLPRDATIPDLAITPGPGDR